MTKRIFRSICFVAIAVFLASVALFLCVLYNYFGNVQRNQLKTQTELAAQGAENTGADYFEGLDTKGYRITWIDTDGAVLFDSDAAAAEMENHLEREEIKEAVEEGYGESSRYSATLMERTLYSAMRLEDGTVVRLSIAQNTMLTLLLGMAQPILIIVAIAIALSFLLAYRLSRHITEPLNRLNLDDPLNNEGYDELSPLLRRIDAQQRKIRLQAEELQTKQEEFEAVTENMTEGIVVLNPKGIILSINSAAARLFDTTKACIGQHMLSVNRCMEISDLLSAMEKGVRAEKSITLQGRTYQMDISPVSEDGSVTGAVLLVLDVTEKAQAEQMRQEFTANVSHELKTPLQIIAGSAELLSNGIVKEEDRKSFYDRILTESQRMIRLVEDIIRLSHLDEGANEMKRENVDLFALANETVKSLQTEAENAQITMRLEGTPAILYGIPQLLRSLIFNLCDNAIKYNRAGGTVAVQVKTEKDRAILSVADTGIGISPEHQNRIFERFYRVDKSRSKELGGTGLGLSIVKHAARLHEAEIALNSAENEGTTITVTFPMAN